MTARRSSLARTATRSLAGGFVAGALAALGFGSIAGAHRHYTSACRDRGIRGAFAQGGR